MRANPGYALLGPMATLNFYAYSDCKVILLNDGILPVYLSIPLAKHSLYSSYFSTKLVGNWKRRELLNTKNVFTESEKWWSEVSRRNG